jgi:serine protease Do
MRLLPVTALVRGTLTVLVLAGGTGHALAQEAMTPVVEQVNRKLVKLYGGGGYKGLPHYGTGFLVSPKGYILTVNNHILGTPDIKVHMYDGRLYHARVVSKEPELDVALLKLEDTGLESLPYFDVDEAAARPPAAPGDWILACSNTFNIATREEPMSVQHGGIAAYTQLHGRRGVYEAPFTGNVYFLDVVCCNPGAAGGVITTRKGELVGIIGRELKNTLSDSWINYAVPINAKVKAIVDDKETTVDIATFVKKSIDGSYRMSTKKKLEGPIGYHGIVFVPNVVTVTPPYVEDVVPGSPAAKAGLRPDDLVVYVEGELIPSIRSFRDMIRSIPPGTEVRLEVQRGSRLETVVIKMAERPKK